MTERDGFEFADVISDVIHRRDVSMDSHHFQLWLALLRALSCFSRVSEALWRVSVS